MESLCTSKPMNRTALCGDASGRLRIASTWRSRRDRRATDFAARQFGGRGVCRFSWCLLFVLWLFGARVPQLVARHPALRDATHAYFGEQTPLSLSSPAIVS